MQLKGGLTTSVFPGAEAWLSKSSEHQQVLRDLDGAQAYRSVMDLVLCTVFPHFSAECAAYYEGVGPQLRAALSVLQLSRLDDWILQFLEEATRQRRLEKLLENPQDLAQLMSELGLKEER
jgi:hypothetical protein